MSEKNAGTAEEDYSIPLPEDVLDPNKLYTRTEIFNFYSKDIDGDSDEDSRR